MPSTSIKAKAIPATSVDQLIRDAEREIAHLQAKLEAYREIKQSAVSWDWNTNPDEEMPKQAENSQGKKPGPKAYILAILQEQPGLEAKQIITAAKGRIETAAINFDRNIYSTLYDLKHRGLIKKEAGGFYLAKQE